MVFNNTMNNFFDNEEYNNDNYNDNDMINQGIPDIKGLVEISKATAIENILTEYYKKIFNIQLKKNICKNEALIRAYEEYQSLKDE